MHTRNPHPSHHHIVTCYNTTTHKSVIQHTSQRPVEGLLVCTMRLTFEVGDLLPQHVQHLMFKSTIEGIRDVLPGWGWVMLQVPVTTNSADLSLTGMLVGDRFVCAAGDVQPPPNAII